MHDDHDRLLEAAFADFTDTASPRLRPAGLAPVRATVRHRRTVRISALCAVAVLAVIAPVAAFAAQNHGGSGPPTPASSTDTPAPVLPPPSAAPSTTPPDTTVTGDPTVAPTQADCAHPADAIRDLCGATFALPSPGHHGACPQGSMTFKQGRSGVVRLIETVPADVDHDGTPDIVARYECTGANPGTDAVVAFTRTAGGLHPLGDFPTYTDDPGRISWVPAIAADQTGRVWLVAGNLIGSGGPSLAQALTQWRGYRWNGSAFVQDRGSTSFTTPSRGLKVSGVKLTLRNGSLLAALTVTVRNDGPDPVKNVTLPVYLPWSQQTTEGDCPAAHLNPSEYKLNSCDAGTLQPGASKTFDLHWPVDTGTAAALKDPATDRGTIYLRIGDQQAATLPIPVPTT